MQKTILVIEDDHDIRNCIKDLLESEDYRVVTAVNGKDGLEKFQKGPAPALVLLDMMMPVMSGRAFLDSIKNDSKLSAIPVIVFSATPNLYNVEGSVAVIKKPSDLERLLNLIAQHAA